jgi:uncharacterized alpha-E superfamily protein
MLSRTADHLFWMARYMERAENTARMLDVNYQTSLLPQSRRHGRTGLARPAVDQRADRSFSQAYAGQRAQRVMDFMVRDETNRPASWPACAPRARTHVPCAAR